MKNTRHIGMIGGLIGGAICLLGGLICLLQGLIAAGNGGGALPPGLYFAMGFYFVGKGIFAAGISLNAADRTSTNDGS
jgi:hypothetical protein